jgi:hypothetical protein
VCRHIEALERDHRIGAEVAQHAQRPRARDGL